MSLITLQTPPTAGANVHAYAALAVSLDVYTYTIFCMRHHSW